AYYLPAPILADDLDARLLKSYAGRRSSLDLFLPAALENPTSPWCDKATTPAAEDCASRLQEALGVALADIESRAGTADMAAWRWDSLHLALFAHNPLDRIPALQSTFSNVIGNGGDGNTVNVAPVAVDQPFDQTHGPMYRHVIDLGDLAASRFINTPGQAGHPFSDHYDDLIERWQRVEYLPMRFDRASVEAAAEATLRLEPQP
ncbi:MAG TPA: penicillin acylase family protein, partial [Herpetosiphonaceae bacterium]